MLGNTNKCSGHTIGIDDTLSSQGQLKFRHSKACACRESVESREMSVKLVEEHAVARDEKAAEQQVAKKAAEQQVARDKKAAELVQQRLI